MRHFRNLLIYELRVLCLTPATYIAALLFLVLMLFLYLFILEGFSQTPQEGTPTTEFFKVFWIPLFFLVPLLTMKSIAEERRQGTLQSLMTTPISTLSIVLSKFFSTYFFYLLIWASTLLFPVIVNLIVPLPSSENQLLQNSALIGSFSFIAISGVLYIALGLFASSLTQNQHVAGMFAFCLLFVCVVGGKLLLDLPFLEFPSLAWLKAPLECLDTFRYLEDFSRGIIDTRPFFFYISNGVFLLCITSLIVQSKH